MRSKYVSIVSIVIILIFVILIMTFTGKNEILEEASFENDGMPPAMVGNDVGGNNFRPEIPQDREIPQELIDACSGLVDGDSCLVTTPRGDINGVCSNIDDVISCKPEMEMK